MTNGERFKLYSGDCLELMRQLPDKSVDMILCDLPYGTTQNKWDALIPFAELWGQYERVAKGNAAIVLTAAQPFTSALVMSNPVAFKYQWIWEKSAATGFLNAKKQPLRAHEDIAVFYLEQPTYNPQMREGAVIKRLNPSFASHGGNYGKRSSIRAPYESGSRYPRSVLNFPKDNRLKQQHPTQKPVALMEYLIRTYTNEGDTVLDNCMGSGTTGVACMNTGRNFIGMEREREYLNISHSRIAESLGAEQMTVYFTPYNPATLQATGPSSDSGFGSVAEAVQCLGADWATCSNRAAFYPAQGLAVTDYVLSKEVAQ